MEQTFDIQKIYGKAMPKWFALRSKLYSEVAQWNNRLIEEIHFDFSVPDSGWMDVKVYVDGKLRHVFHISAAFDPFPEMRRWMEEIAKGRNLSNDLLIRMEGTNCILQHEHLDNRKGIGLFFLYDSCAKDIPVVCCCNTKQLLLDLYCGLMWYAAKSNAACKIGKDWYYIDRDIEGNPTEDNWTFYNVLKSPIVEWYLDEVKPPYLRMPRQGEKPFIKETVYMWAEWGDGLFWHQRGGCCGNAEKFCVDNAEDYIDLTDMPELRKWYDEFDDSDPCVEWEDDVYDSWFHRGWQLAKEVRKRLPESVDLFYHWNYLTHKIEGKHVELPILVLDGRLIK